MNAIWQGETPAIPLDINELGHEQSFYQVICSRCWQNNPELRPEVHDIAELLSSQTKLYGLNQQFRGRRSSIDSYSPSAQNVLEPEAEAHELELGVADAISRLSTLNLGNDILSDSAEAIQKARIWLENFPFNQVIYRVHDKGLIRLTFV